MAISGDYSSFISKLESKGLATTSLSSGETDFQQYAQALSGDLQNEVLQSFDNDRDYQIQQMLAEYFQSTNVVDSGSFESICASLGLSCSVEYVSTSYIVDWKSSQSGAVVDGAIAVYTISDGQGGEIKIVDANGNGYVETEELFMNEILGDIGSSLAANGTANSSALTGAEGVTNQGPDQETFNLKVEEYLDMDLSLDDAEAQVRRLLNASEQMHYTGNYKVKLNESPTIASSNSNSNTSSHKEKTGTSYNSIYQNIAARYESDESEEDENVGTDDNGNFYDEDDYLEEKAA